MTNDAVITVLGVAAGISLGIIGVYERIQDKRHSLLKRRIDEEEEELSKTYKLLEKYIEKYGKLE